jgi:hypothetical protein
VTIEGVALIYLDPAMPTVRACFMRSAVFATNRPDAPMSSSSAEAMMARQIRSMDVNRRGLCIVPIGYG